MPILTDQERCGTLIGVYRLESILGRGGMGVVFRARNEQTQRPVAVKILRPELAMQHASFAKRFVREAKAAAAIKHPNVVEVFDVGTEPDGTAYQVLALLEGETLRDHLARKQRLSVSVALDILLPVMHALEAAHAASVVHRDLKPDNIFLARQPNGDVVPTLLDFGIAKLLEGHESFATNTGSILGTPSYMAPEQATGARVQGLGIDIWAMGIILFECLSGAPPFTGSSPPHVMLKIMTETPAPLDELVPTVPRAIADVVSHALQRNLADRLQSMHDFRAALRAAAGECAVAIPEEGRISTHAAMSIAPPPSSSEIDLSIAIDSAVRPRANADAATVAATGPIQVVAPEVAVPAVIAGTLTPAPGIAGASRRPLLIAGVASVIAASLATAVWLSRPPPPEPPSILVAAPHVEPPEQPPRPESLRIEPPHVEVTQPMGGTSATEPTVPVTPPIAPGSTPPGRRIRPRHGTQSAQAGHPVEPPPEHRADPGENSGESMRPRTGLPGVVAW